MLNLGLTGNIAAGKSTVAELFRGWGATIIDADQLAREAQAPGSPVLHAIVERFGPTVLLADGGLDRARLRAIVLEDPAARHALEDIVHPAVQALRAGRLDMARAAGDRIVVNEIPLLFESLDPEAFDAVVLVDAPEPVRRARLMTDRGLGEAEAKRMIAAQMPTAEKRAWRGGPHDRGAWIIENDADRATLDARARAVWEAVTQHHPAA